MVNFSHLDSNDEYYRLQADKFWDTRVILEKLGVYNQSHPSDKVHERAKKVLWTFLCRKSTKTIAKLLFLTEKTVKKYLSESVYPFLRFMVGLQEKSPVKREIYDLLEERGYSRPVEISLDSISKKYPGLESEVILRMVEELHRTELTQKNEPELITKGHDVIKKGDDLTKKNKYIQAIQLYVSALEESHGACRRRALIKVATCFDRLGAYHDCVQICEYIETHLSPDINSDHKKALAEIDNMKGGCYYELMRISNSKIHLVKSVKNYAQAFSKMPTNSSYPWHIFEAWVSYCNQGPERWNKNLHTVEDFFNTFQKQAALDGSTFLTNPDLQHDITEEAIQLVEKIPDSELARRVWSFFEKYFLFWQFDSDI